MSVNPGYDEDSLGTNIQNDDKTDDDTLVSRPKHLPVQLGTYYIPTLEGHAEQLKIQWENVNKTINDDVYNSLSELLGKERCSGNKLILLILTSYSLIANQVIIIRPSHLRILMLV